MASPEVSSKILIIEDNPEVLGMLESMLSREGFETLSTDNGSEAFAIAKDQGPDIVLIDLNMPSLEGLDVCRKLKEKPETQDSIVIIVSAITDVTVKERGFQSGAVDYIQKPFRQGEFIARLNAQLRQKKDLDTLRRQFQNLRDSLAQSLDNLSEGVDQECIVEEKKVLSIPSDTDRVQSIINQLLIGLGGDFDKARADIALGLHETIVNAIEHGNLGITSEEKNQSLENQTYMKLLEERQRDPQYSSRKVTIEYTLTDRVVQYKIRDEGAGFDWRSFIEREAPNDLLALHGRGIMICRHLFDSMEYNEVGNEVTLTKELG